MMTTPIDQKFIRPDSLTGPPVTGKVGNANDPAGPILIINANAWSKHVRVPQTKTWNVPLTGNSATTPTYTPGVPEMSVTIHGDAQSAIATGVHNLLSGGGVGAVNLMLENGHYITGTLTITGASFHSQRQNIRGRMLHLLRLPSYGPFSITGVLSGWSEVCG